MTRQDQVTVGGAVVGGTAGAVPGGGVLGTAAGAAVGGAIGHEVTKPKQLETGTANGLQIARIQPALSRQRSVNNYLKTNT